jgi:hypothetical protein
MIFNEIIELRPYFFSLREINNNVSLDVKLPVTWKYDSIITKYKGIKMKVQDNGETTTLISLISNATMDGYEMVFSCVKEIIQTNVEMEEKNRLFQIKVKELEISFKSQVKELETLFLNEPLDKIKELTIIDDGKQETTVESPEGTGLAEQGNGKGPEGNNNEQDKVD